MRRISQKLLAMLMALVMVVGMLPVPAFAADKTIYVLAGGDFQQAGDHTGSAENVRNILAQISQKYDTMDGMLFVGDYDCDTHGDANETANGITALMGAVQGSYSNLNDANSVLVQGNHDYKDSRIDATGGHDFDGYSVFVLNEDDYPNGGGSQAGIQTLANSLKTWLNNKIGEGYSAPIFIVSHLPLAYTPRTVTQGDAKYAKYIFDVLNDAGKNGLNIIFLHGHDHAYGPDNYMGGEAIYLPVGDKICIAEAGSTSAWTEETLNFTYMNAGYTGYYSDPYTYVTTAGTDKLTMTVFAITDNQVTVERYSEDGQYNLKSAGYDGSYSNTSVTNVSLGLPKYSAVYASPQTITLTQRDASEMGTIGEWVGVTTEATDDVKPSGNEWVTLTEPSTGEPIFKLVDKLTAGKKYVIANRNTAGNGSATSRNNNNGIGSADIVVISDSEGIYIKTAATSAQWIWTNDGYLQNVGSTSRYLKRNDNRNTLTTNGTPGITTQYVTWSYDDSYGLRVKQYRYTGNTYRYMTSVTGTANSSSTTNRVYIYEEATLPAANGLYAYLKGDLTYNATVGMSADEAMALVKGGIDGYYVEAMSAPGSDVAGTKVDDSVLTWEWVDTFDGNTAGDYAVKVSYNGKELGTAEVVVPASTTYYVAEGNGLYLVDMNTTEANALAAVKAGVTVSSATDANGTGKKEVPDGEVTWTWKDKYNGADSGPYTVEILKDGTSLGTVEVKVNIQYETGINSDWTYIGETAGTGGKYYQRVESLSELQDGEQYLIILDCSNQTKDDAFVIPTIVTYNSGSNARRGADVVASNGITDNATITGDYDDYLWTFTKSGTGWKIGNGSQYINVANNRTTSRGELSLTTSGETLTIATGVNSSDNKYINDYNSYGFAIYDSDSLYWQYNTTATLVYATSGDSYESRFVFYKVVEEEVTPGGPIYALIEGNTVYTVEQGTSADAARAKVKAGITGYTATDANGTGKTEIADSDLTWKWKNTFNGNSTGSYWVEISYQGKVLGTVEVKVEPGTVNNYPEYPDEGSVKVSKTGTGIDFQSSGIAQVEISASGVPIKKGADVIVMLDTSSSMAYCLDCTNTRHSSYVCDQGGQTRAQALEETLADMITQFKTPGADGQIMDIDVAIADFNGFYSSGQFARDGADTMSDDISYSADSQAKVYTGDGSLGSGAFISAEDLAASYSLNYTSGTNYDYAFDAIYQMATAKQEANTEERDLYVIFMSDGAAMQWNYYHSQGGSNLWENWITGAWTANQLTTTNLNCTTHAYYYDEVDHNGDGMLNEHRMANAVKGDPSEQYEVIRKTDTLGTPTGETNMYMVPGLGAKLFAIAFDPRTDSQVEAQHMVDSIETLASEQTGTTKYFYNVSSADALANAFTAIGSEIAYAAYNARYVDQMGDDYNLQMKTSVYEVVENGAEVNKTLAPKIEIITYDIYTRQDYLNGTIPENKIGDRKGTYTALETVTFNADGTEAYSDQINGGKTNILADGTQAGYVKGVIYAKTFLYNTNATAVAVEGVSIPTGTNADGTTKGSTNVLPAETFYWKMGTVQTSELAMRYYVYLEGSMEGTREGGSYPTNEYATLYYDNYLHNPCKKDTVSPVMPWKEANVSYAFYLVNDKGEIIVNQTTGLTGSFANKIAVTNPVVYDTVLLNTSEQLDAVQAARVLPDGYTLYDGTYDNGNLVKGATYTVTVNSNTTGGWAITSVKDVATTYVVNYDPNNATAYSKDKSESQIGHDYTHTTVWFAVVWKVQALPDSVVIDYGLPVDISVLTNDMFGEKGKLAGVGANSDSLNLTGHDENLASGFGTNYTGFYGTAKADTATGKVRYTVKDMQMNGYEKFAYAVNYTGSENAGYYYDTVTVIPATTIYYEDNFLTYSGDGTQWEDEGTAVNGATQAEDRPGQYSLTDANNIYGYDAVNNGMATFSLGTAKKVHVGPAEGYKYGTSATAEFTFAGTGFDVISMTSNTTGVIALDVMDANGEYVANRIVNTYYGYTTEEHEILYTYTDGKWISEDKGKVTADTVVTAMPENPEEGNSYTAKEQIWVVTPDTDNALYQVPVLQVEGLPYGTYTAKIIATYIAPMDKTAGITYDDKGNITANDGYDLYLDAVRIYDPANDGAVDNDTTIEDAYKADGEGWPSYIELRNNLIEADSFGNDDGADENGNDDTVKINGLVFIDGDAEVGDAQLADYISYGPNNEVYLAVGQSVAFLLSNVTENVAQIHIGIKSANGASVACTIENIAEAEIISGSTKVSAGTRYNKKLIEVNTTTDMYYDMTGWKNDIVVISNTGTEGSIISLTNIKATYKADPNGTTVASEDAGIMVLSLDEEEPAAEAAGEVGIYMTPAAATLTLRALNAPAVEEPETPVEPDEPVTPDEPETPVEPDEPVTPDEPEQPEEPEVPQQPSYEEIVQTVVKKVVKTIKSLLNWLFK